MRKGYEVTGLRYAESRTNGIFHLYDERGRILLCDCSKCCVIEHRLGMKYRKRCFRTFSIWVRR